MLKRLIKNKKGQNTAEYAILISLVVASIVAMQTYAQRALNARVKDAADFMTVDNPIHGLNTMQYEPYYQESAYGVNSDVKETVTLDVNVVRGEVDDDSLRTGFTRTNFNQDKTTGY